MSTARSIACAWLLLACAPPAAAQPAAAEPAPTLKPSTRLGTLPGEDDPRRQQADALRRALVTDVDRAAQAVQQREANERELDALRGQSRKVPAIEAQLKAQADKARRERNGLLLMAAVLLAVMGAAAAFVFRRSQRGAPPQDPAAASPSAPGGSPTH